MIELDYSPAIFVVYVSAAALDHDTIPVRVQSDDGLR